MRKSARLGLGLLAVLTLAGISAAWVLRSALAELPDVASLLDYRPPIVTTVWSRDGVLMADFAEERRRVVDAAGLPAHVVRAFLAAEDSQFFTHEGLNWRGIVRAAFANLREGRVVQGGSTITQQVAKSLLLSPERSFRRKIREAVLAVRIERNLSKEQILHLYLNQIYLGHGAYGVESAAEIYFGTTAQKLSLAQAALLAGLPQAPSRYDPYQHPERALERRRYVLHRMSQESWISEEGAREGSDEPLELTRTPSRYLSVSPHFSEHVRRSLEASYGADVVQREGLRVTTTMDSRLQAAAREALRKGLEAVDRRSGYRGAVARGDDAATAAVEQADPPRDGQRSLAAVRSVTDEGAVVAVGGREVPLPRTELAWALPRSGRPEDVLQAGDVILCEFAPGEGGELVASLVQEPEVEGALVCLDAHTGEVLALAGGYDFSRSQFNRAVQAQRQPGSAIKPLIYASAIEKGFTPATLIYDTPIVYDSPDLDEKWKPKNYSERFYGATTLREALVHSRNVVTVKVLRDVGIGYAVDFLQRMGIASPINADLSLALGASSVSLLELTDVYGAFAAGGVRREPVFLLRTEDRDGRLLQEFHPGEGAPSLRPETAYILTHMMQAVIQEGTGRQARGLGRPAAGKTGTTNENRDAWFLGFTPDLVTGVWVGYDDGRSLAKGETGGRAAAPVWLDFMRQAVAGTPPSDFTVPEGIEFARVDAATGRLAGPGSDRSFTAAFLRGTVADEAPSAQAAPASATTPLDLRDPGTLDLLR